MDFSRDPLKQQKMLMDTMLAGVGCVTPEEKAGVLSAGEGEWRILLQKLRSNYEQHHLQDIAGMYGDENKHLIMLQNTAIV